MKDAAEKTARSSRSAAIDRPVVYRGIKIAPMSGKRSAVAEAIRDALWTKSGASRAEPAHR